jgi:DNA-binding NarL/FixJ family response regulator
MAATQTAVGTDIRIVIADDHEIFRRGIAAVLESNPRCKVVAEAHNGEAAVEAVRQHHPDVAILDFSMPNGKIDGLTAAREIHENMPEVRILILTMHANTQLVQEMLRAGVHAYVTKSDGIQEVTRAIESIINDKLFFTDTISRLMVEQLLPTQPLVRIDKLLTPREHEIVKLLASGRSNKEVATGLNISLRTAETHRANIMSKLQLHSVQDLVRYAIKNRLVD